MRPQWRWLRDGVLPPAPAAGGAHGDHFSFHHNDLQRDHRRDDRLALLAARAREVSAARLAAIAGSSQSGLAPRRLLRLSDQRLISDNTKRGGTGAAAGRFVDWLTERASIELRSP